LWHIVVWSRPQIPSPMPRSRAPLRRTAAKRQVTWISPADQGYVAVASGTKVLIASFEPGLAANNMNRPTVIRTRGQVSIKPGAFNADLDMIGAFGAGVVSTDAFAAGVASVPGPFTDADWDGWFMWRSFSAHLELEGASPAVNFLASWQQEIDSKAMRKMGINTTLVMVAESQGGSFQISMPLRLLFKLG